MTPIEGHYSVVVPMDTLAGEFAHRAMKTLGVTDPAEHVLLVPLPDGEGNVSWHPVDDDTPLLDALRGLQRPPRIVHRSEVENND